MLITPSAAEARAWLGGQREATIGAKHPDLVQTAELLDNLGVSVAHLYPAPRRTRMEELRESREPDRDEQLQRYMNQAQVQAPCSSAAVGWFEEGGEAKELVAYHFGDAVTAAAATRDVEDAWEDPQARIRVRDIRQEGPLVYVVRGRTAPGPGRARAGRRQSLTGNFPFGRAV